MGSHYFSNCTPEERFTAKYPYPRMEGGDDWQLFDWDQRRSLVVGVPKDVDEEYVVEAAAKFMDDLPANVLHVVLDADGNVESTASDPLNDPVYVPFYPPRTDFPRRVPTVRRRDLTEVDRLGLQVDLVTYSPKAGETKRVVFKYYVNVSNVVLWWHEANCVLRMPKHPNIVPFDAFVVDKVGGVDKVVGFTTKYIPGETLSKNKNRVFKLKYLEQLINAVDFLNLKLGIVHGDICPWNLLIDPSTDSIQLFDFNSAAKLGWEGDMDNRLEFEYESDRNDVKFVTFTLYEIITREFEFRLNFYPHELDAADVMKKKTWPKHAGTQLDHPVEDYRRVLREWVKRRAETDKKVDHFSKAAEPLEWPPLQVCEFMKWDVSPLLRRGRMRCTMVQLGKEFPRWERPPTKKLPLPRGQRLLATGEVVQDTKGGSCFR